MAKNYSDIEPPERGGGHPVIHPCIFGSNYGVWLVISLIIYTGVSSFVALEEAMCVN